MNLLGSLYLYPLASALLFILALPPANLWWLGLCAFSFLYYSFRSSKNLSEALICGSLFGFFLSLYLSISVAEGFRWIEGGQIMEVMLYLVCLVIIILTSVLSALVAGISFKLAQVLYHKYSPEIVLVVMSTISPALYLIIDRLLSEILQGFNYGSLQYVILKSPSVYYLSVVPIDVLIYLLLLINVAMVEFLLTRKKYFPFLFLILIYILIINPLLRLELIENVTYENESIKVAVIQSQERDASIVFGNVMENKFRSLHLESLVKEAGGYNPDIIVYPFAPWTGTMMGEGSSAVFDQDIIAVNQSQFTDWAKTYIPKDVLFVTWYSVYRDGEFYNEVGYWRNGEFLGAYQKQSLFPFFDYTPSWAQNHSLFSVPFDSSPGLTVEPLYLSGTIFFGSIICSEITNDKAIAKSSLNVDLLMSIGSEAMFTHEIPSTFNFLQARGIASSQAMPVIRATKFGPSGIFDSKGQVISELGFGEEGILVAEVNF